MDKQVLEKAKKLCRDLRKRQTRSETSLWEALRNRKFHNMKFFRQHPIFFTYDDIVRFFIADFYCRERSLVIELDGKSHDYQQDYDESRTAIIESCGITVVRFTNREIEEDLRRALVKLEQIVHDSTSNSPRSPSLYHREGS